MSSVDVESFEGTASAKPVPTLAAPRVPPKPASAVKPVQQPRPLSIPKLVVPPAKAAVRIAAPSPAAAKPVIIPGGPAAIPPASPILRPAAPPASPPEVDADVAHLLASWKRMGGAPLETLSVEQARSMPALSAVQTRYMRPGDDFGVDGTDLHVPGAAGRLEARLYRRRQNRPGLDGALIVHFGSGGFVTGSLDATDPVARVLCQRTGAQVLSVLTRRAPEHKFPAAHDDSMAVWRWIIANAHSLGIEPTRIAVSGEGAGANLALNIALSARLEKIARPVHVAMITPIAGMTYDTASHRVNAGALPLGTPGMKWIGQQILAENKHAYDRRLALSMRPDLGSAPPVTLILAGADPLRSDAEALGVALGKSRVPVGVHLYEGVPHDFFSLFLVVNKAMFAMSEVSFALADAVGNGAGV